MDFESLSGQKRSEQRKRMVLPLRVSAKDGSGICSTELAHTLDISSHGARLGAIRHEVEMGTKLLIQYRQRRFEARVVWIKRLEGTNEYQVGVELLTTGANTWGLDLNVAPTTEPEPELVMA